MSFSVTYNRRKRSLIIWKASGSLVNSRRIRTESIHNTVYLLTRRQSENALQSARKTREMKWRDRQNRASSSIVRFDKFGQNPKNATFIVRFLTKESRNSLDYGPSFARPRCINLRKFFELICDVFTVNRLMLPFKKGPRRRLFQ